MTECAFRSAACPLKGDPMAEGRAATLSDVAREAGVSLATASRAYNGSDRVVGRELRERVLAAA